MRINIAFVHRDVCIAEVASVSLVYLCPDVVISVLARCFVLR